ncbi:hypothetical protein D3C72_1396370 [compost metagenome]
MGADEVETGFGLARIGDGGGAYIKIAPGGGQLLLHRRFLCLHEAHGVFGGQYIKIGLGHPHQQVLGCGVELEPGDVGAELSLLQCNAVGGPVQRLAGNQAQLVVGAGDRQLRLADFGAAVLRLRLQGDLWQQSRTGLLCAADGRIHIGACGQPCCVVAAGLLGHLRQALAVGGSAAPNEQCACNAGVEPQETGQGRCWAHGI